MNMFDRRQASQNYTLPSNQGIRRASQTYFTHSAGSTCVKPQHRSSEEESLRAAFIAVLVTVPAGYFIRLAQPGIIAGLFDAEIVAGEHAAHAERRHSNSSKLSGL